jgi:hypothetical protein
LIGGSLYRLRPAGVRHNPTRRRVRCFRLRQWVAIILRSEEASSGHVQRPEVTQGKSRNRATRSGVLSYHGAVPGRRTCLPSDTRDRLAAGGALRDFSLPAPDYLAEFRSTE